MINISLKNQENKPIIYSGGGYFRLFPYYLINKWSKNSKYVMTYFHPRDFDKNQPIISDLSLARKFKSYVGLSGAATKLETWLNNDQFLDVSTADQKINWNEVPVVKL
mgnify:FL=1